MGQKTNPVGFRLGINRTWDSRWFSTKEYSKWLDEDIKVRTYIKRRLYQCRRCAYRDRALRRQGDRQYLYGAPGHGHRPQGV